MQYQTEITKIKLDNIELSFETFKDFSSTVDAFCEFYSNSDDSKILEEHCPYFGHIWPSGLVLSQYLINLKLKDKKILEIGCGLSIPSFICKKLNLDIVATDFHSDVEQFMNKNQKLNSIYFEFKKRDWKNLDNLINDFELIIGSDILYEFNQIKTLTTLFKNSKKGQEIIITDPGRSYIQTFLDEMISLGFIYKKDMQIQKNPLGDEEIFILHLIRS